MSEVQIAQLYTVSGSGQTWETVPCEELELTFAGIRGDRHYGLYREFKAYEGKMFSGLKVPNDRQLSIIDVDDLGVIGETMELPVEKIEERPGLVLEDFLARSLAVNIVLRGLEGAINTYLQPGMIIGASNATQRPQCALKIHEYNPPCSKPAKMLLDTFKQLAIAYEDHDFVSIKARFKAAATNKRGWLASVYAAGRMAAGDPIITRSPQTAE